MCQIRRGKGHAVREETLLILGVDSGHVEPPPHQGRQHIPGGYNFPGTMENNAQASAALPFQSLEPRLEQPGVEYMIPLIRSLKRQLASFRRPGGKRQGNPRKQRDQPAPHTHDYLASRPCRVRLPREAAGRKTRGKAMLID